MSIAEETHRSRLGRGLAALIGDAQVRNLGTIGGSLAHADPSADWPAVLLALDASVTIAGSDRKSVV